MPRPTSRSSARRLDAERNRDSILATARTAFADPGAEIPMADGETPGAALLASLRRFFAFPTSKRHTAAELLTHVDGTNPECAR